MVYVFAKFMKVTINIYWLIKLALYGLMRLLAQRDMMMMKLAL